MNRPMVAPFDLLSNLAACFLALFVLLSITQKTTSSIDTLGYYAITVTWERGSPDDVDLWIKAPDGLAVGYANSDSDALHLEHDDLGAPDAVNYERTLITALQDGEYIINVHAYELPRPAHVHVEVWRLRGRDTKVFEKDVALTQQGQEVTVTRFSPPGKFRDLSAHIVG